MSYLPISLEVAGRRCLIVGAGKVAARRARALAEHGARVVVVAPDAAPEMEELARGDDVEWNRGPYSARFIEGAYLVVAAADDEAVNDEAANDAALRGIPVCRADAVERGDFLFPAVVERGSLQIAVSTGGSSPTLATVLRDEIAVAYGEEWAAVTELVGALRDTIKESGATETARREAVRRILADETTRRYLIEGKLKEAEARARECL